MEYPKFILTSTGHFRYGMVHLHKDLLLLGESCYGGGFYEFDYVQSRMLLSGASYDFGRPRWEWMDELKVPAELRGLRIVSVPADSQEPDFCLNEAFELQYV